MEQTALLHLLLLLLLLRLATPPGGSVASWRPMPWTPTLMRAQTRPRFDFEAPPPVWEAAPLVLACSATRSTLRSSRISLLMS
jgi:hypothetical protein